MLKSNLCDYNDAYTIIGGTITIKVAPDDAAAREAGEKGKKGAKRLPISFSPVTSTKVGISPKAFWLLVPTL